MSTVARRREALLLRYMYRYNKDFAPEGTRLWYDYDQEYSIEGGDVLVLSKDIVAIGLSQRTTAGGIERFAENILKESSFQKILVFDIPKSRAFMHLDTVFTMVDYDKFTIHPEIEGPLQIYEITLSGDGKAHFESIQGELEDILSSELKLPAVELIRCGGDDPMAAQREQWNDGFQYFGDCACHCYHLREKLCNQRSSGEKRYQGYHDAQLGAFQRKRRPKMYELPGQQRRSVTV